MYLLRVVLAERASNRVAGVVAQESPCQLVTVLCGALVSELGIVQAGGLDTPQDGRTDLWRFFDVADVIEVLRCLPGAGNARVTVSPNAAARLALVGHRAEDWGTVTVSAHELSK